MTRPEEALSHAREQAAQARAAGGYARSLPAEPAGPAWSHRLERMLELAVLEPDLDQVRSTRRLGAPITFAKRALVRTLDQYNRQLIAQQQAYNRELALFVAQLATRVDELEAGRPPR